MIADKIEENGTEQTNYWRNTDPTTDRIMVDGQTPIDAPVHYYKISRDFIESFQ